MVVYIIYIYILYGGGGPPGPKNARADFLSQSSPDCSSRLNVNMHLLISLAQKQIQYSSKMNKNSEMQSQNMTQTCNN